MKNDINNLLLTGRIFNITVNQKRCYLKSYYNDAENLLMLIAQDENILKGLEIGKYYVFQCHVEVNYIVIDKLKELSYDKENLILEGRILDDVEIE